MGFWDYKYFIFGRVQNIFVHIFVLIVVNILLAQEVRLKAVNENLRVGWRLSKRDLERIFLIYEQLRAISEMFNKLFGYTILFILVLIACAILDISNFIITAGIHDKRFGFTLAASSVIVVS